LPGGGPIGEERAADPPGMVFHSGPGGGKGGEEGSIILGEELVGKKTGRAKKGERSPHGQ